jgi:hypothetical protein
MTLIENTASYENPLTGTVHTLERPGARWAQSLSFRFKTEDERARLQAFLASLRGQANRAVMPVFGHTNRTNGAGAPLVSGAGQTGAALLVDGWAGNIPVLSAGDFFSVNGELKMVTADAASDVTGTCTVNFAPILRASPANNAPLTITSPTARYILASPQVGWSNTPWRSGPASDFQLEFVEVFS